MDVKIAVLVKAFALSAVLLLGACSGWVADSPLMPPSSRDITSLSGNYETEDGQINIKLLSDKLYEIVAFSKEEDPFTYYASFDLLTSRIENGTPVDTYLIEMSNYSSDSAELYVKYELGNISTVAGEDSRWTLYEVSCSEAAKRISGSADDADACKFTNYNDVKRAARDVLDWLSDPRAEIVKQYVVRPADDASAETNSTM